MIKEGVEVAIEVLADSIKTEEYKTAFSKMGYSFIESDFQNLLHKGLYPVCQNLEYIREQKNMILRSYEGEIRWIKGAEQFLEHLLSAGINFAIVTNTSRDNVAFFKQKVPLLSRVSQWITREDTPYGKPHSQPYEEAKNRFWKQEPYIIGFENTLSGLRSIEKVTRCIYYIGLAKNEDIYMINDYSKVK
jgi:beta-phosphoglucomutase-like phosphatase (HAD superfamily)